MTRGVCRFPAMAIGKEASMLLLTCQARARGFKIAGSGERAGQRDRAELVGVGGGKGRAWRGLTTEEGDEPGCWLDRSASIKVISFTRQRSVGKAQEERHCQENIAPRSHGSFD